MVPFEFILLSFFLKKGDWGEAYDDIFKIHKFLSTWGFKRDKERRKTGAILRFEMDRHFREF